MNYVDDYIAALSNRTCAQDLEYSAEFIALEQAVNVGDSVQYGEHIYLAPPIDWAHVETLCRGLHEVTLDLRVVVLLTRSLLELYGMAGFIGGLRLVSGVVHQHWESVHPQLLAADQFDPLIRINTLAELVAPTTVMTLKRQTLATAPDGRGLCAGDLDVICHADGTPTSHCLALLASLIEPHCSADLMRSLGQLNALRLLLDEISRCLEEKAVQGISPFHGLSKSLLQWANVVEDRLRRVAPLWPASIPQDPMAPRLSGSECESREDVTRALDAICAYYQRNEPSSPVPFLIARIRRLTTMSFIDIIEELAPDSVADLRRLGGRSNAH